MLRDFCFKMCLIFNKLYFNVCSAYAPNLYYSLAAVNIHFTIPTEIVTVTLFDMLNTGPFSVFYKRTWFLINITIDQKPRFYFFEFFLFTLKNYSFKFLFKSIGHILIWFCSNKDSITIRMNENSFLIILFLCPLPLVIVKSRNNFPNSPDLLIFFYKYPRSLFILNRLKN